MYKMTRLSRSDPKSKTSALRHIEKTLVSGLSPFVQQNGLSYELRVGENPPYIEIDLNGQTTRFFYDGGLEHYFDSGELTSDTLDKATERTLIFSRLLEKSINADYYNHLVLETDKEELSEDEREEIARWTSRYEDKGFNVVVK